MAESSNVKNKIKELEKILEYFQSDEIDLDEGIKKYEKAMKLASEVSKTLKGYKLKINEIKSKYDFEESEE